MEHVVFFPGPDAGPSFRRFASLDEAVAFVEHLRNAENVAEVSVHALTPVPLAFRAYYRVEVPTADVPAAVDVPVQPVEPLAEMAAELAEVPALLETDMLGEPVDGVPTEAGPMEELLAPVADGEPMLVPVPDGEPVANGKRSLGFFAH